MVCTVQSRNPGKFCTLGAVPRLYMYGTYSTAVELDLIELATAHMNNYEHLVALRRFC